MNTLPEVTADAEEGFADLVFALIRYSAVSGSQQVVARGAHRGLVVGFAATLLEGWDERQLEGTDESVYWGHVEISSTGDDSNNLIVVLDELYGTDLRPTTMQARLLCQAVGLANDPRLAATQPIKIKLFLAQFDGFTVEPVLAHHSILQSAVLGKFGEALAAVDSGPSEAEVLAERLIERVGALTQRSVLEVRWLTC